MTKWPKSISRELHLHWNQIVGLFKVRTNLVRWCNVHQIWCTVHQIWCRVWPNGFGADRRIKSLTTCPLLSSCTLRFHQIRLFYHYHHHLYPSTSSRFTQDGWFQFWLMKKIQQCVLSLNLHLTSSLLAVEGEFLSRGKLISITPGSQPPLLLL